MADEHGTIDLECVEYGEHVVAQAIGGVVVVGGRWGAGESEASASDAIYVIGIRQLRCEFVERVGGVAEAGQKDQWASFATPIKDFQFDVGIYDDELHGVWGRVGFPLGFFCRPLEIQRM